MSNSGIVCVRTERVKGQAEGERVMMVQRLFRARLLFDFVRSRSVRVRFFVSVRLKERTQAATACTFPVIRA